MKKIFAIIMALAMVFALCVTASATGNPDASGKVLTFHKEITAYNPDSEIVYGPNITYTYTVVPAADTELVTITDAPSGHASGEAVTVTVQAGPTLGLTVNGGTAGTAASASGTISFSNTDLLETSPTGVSNIKGGALNFTNVVFPANGVYRYKITEAADAYTTNGVIEGAANASGHIRYVDVYVKNSSTYTDGSLATDWEIYATRCVEASEGTTPITPTTAKTDGYTDSSSGASGSTPDHSSSNADKYKTYNLKVGKTLIGDKSMDANKFPFDVEWTAGTATGNFQFIAEVGGTSGHVQVTRVAQGATTTVNGNEVAADSIYKVGGASAVGTADKDGVLSIANGGYVTYIGIPEGTKSTVTETNNVTGTTYSTTATEKIGTGTAAAIAFTGGTAQKSTNNQVASLVTNSTAIYAQATAPATGSSVEIQYTNALDEISPTGYMVRLAPYIGAVVFAGIALFVILAHKKSRKENA